MHTYSHPLEIIFYSFFLLFLNQMLTYALYYLCSPYGAVTGKIYLLKQHFLPPATSLRFTEIIQITVVLKNTGQELSFDL